MAGLLAVVALVDEGRIQSTMEAVTSTLMTGACIKAGAKTLPRLVLDPLRPVVLGHVAGVPRRLVDRRVIRDNSTSSDNVTSCSPPALTTTTAIRRRTLSKTFERRVRVDDGRGHGSHGV